ILRAWQRVTAVASGLGAGKIELEVRMQRARDVAGGIGPRPGVGIGEFGAAIEHAPFGVRRELLGADDQGFHCMLPLVVTVRLRIAQLSARKLNLLATAGGRSALAARQWCRPRCYAMCMRSQAGGVVARAKWSDQRASCTAHSALKLTTRKATVTVRTSLGLRWIQPRCEYATRWCWRVKCVLS